VKILQLLLYQKVKKIYKENLQINSLIMNIKVIIFQI